MALTKCLIDDKSRKEYVFPTLLNWVERGDILPQKYLYSNQIGAFRYSELIKCGIHQKVYKSFPINVNGSDLNQYFRDNVEKMTGDRIRGQKKIGIFVLGAGLASRELETVRWLMYNYPEIETIRIWLLDISEEMMAKSIKVFKQLDDNRLEIYGFVLDFEESLSELASVREEFGTEIPCFFLLFGNTIANVDQKVFLNTIAQYMLPGDLFVMEYLLADEATYKQSFDDLTSESSKFGTLVQEYDASQDNRYEFVVSPLRILSIPVKHECLKLYRKCLPGKGFSYTYVYELQSDDIQLLNQLGMSRALYPGWQLPMLKIERMLSNYINTVSESTFKEPVLCKIDYSLGQDFTFIYSMMQKGDLGEFVEQGKGLVGTTAYGDLIQSVSFDPQHHAVLVNNHRMEFTPKQYYLLLAGAYYPIEESEEDRGADKIYRKFSELLVAWSKDASGIDYRTEMVLDNMEKLPESEWAVFVSKGFRDIENKIRKNENQAFQPLLPALPQRNQWFLNLSKTCIALPE